MTACSSYKPNCTTAECSINEQGEFGSNLPKAETIAVKASRTHYGHEADYLVISCMDFRLVDELERFMTARGLRDKYDYLILAGAGLGADNTSYPYWDKTFLDHLKLSMDLHKIKGVIIVDHRNCGLYAKLFGKQIESTRNTETLAHQTQCIKLRHLIHSKYPHLKVECLLMDIDAKVETLAPLMSKQEVDQQQSMDSLSK